MKIFAAPECLSDAVAPLVTMNYLAGLRIFKYPRGKLRIVLSLIYLLLLSSIFCVSMYMEYKFYKQMTLLKLEHILYEFVLYICAFVTLYEMVLGYFYTKTINACYQKITKIDETLRQLGSTFNYSEMYFLSIGAVIIWFLYILCSVIVVTVEMRKSVADVSTMIWIIIADVHTFNIGLVLIFEFSIFVRCLQTRFKLVNELLKESVSTAKKKKSLDISVTEDHTKIMDSEQSQNILSTEVSSQLNLQSRIRTSILRKRNLVRSRTRSALSSQFQKQLQMELQNQSNNQFRDSSSVQRSVTAAQYQTNIHLLQTIRQVHLELCRVLKSLCISFGVQIASEIGICIIYFTLFLYELYNNIYQWRVATKGSLIDQISGQIIVASDYVLEIVLVSIVCKHAANEGKKTSAIIQEIYGCCPDIDIREEIQQFNIQIAQSPVEFFTFGISLNYQLLGSCLKTVTTYLVIMIQMSDSLESRKTFERQRAIKEF
ncbi:PREDICTED: uncharacterized protein LOC106748981 [Dinoponera quadriceps]|uniref:Gustatory receptor n=1 Tax=Dinoponera quadriceps TaxID=609295 RepID=A0A6P3XY31_DINQU|nr:PREDICTED: uncharacterized protein LOC106748981 [Dinoponera quadriceps]